MTKIDHLGVGGANRKPRMFFTPAGFESWMPGCFVVPE